jgi:hypothetical protein
MSKALLQVLLDIAKLGHSQEFGDVSWHAGHSLADVVFSYLSIETGQEEYYLRRYFVFNRKYKV